MNTAVVCEATQIDYASFQLRGFERLADDDLQHVEGGRVVPIPVPPIRFIPKPVPPIRIIPIPRLPILIM